MERVVVLRSVSWCGLIRGVLVGALAVLALSLLPATSFAQESHYPDDEISPDVFDPEGNCYNCHTLDTAEGAANTSFIQKSARTMPRITAGGQQAPDNLGCTFCHYSLTSSREMHEVFTHFGSKLSKHPVGKKVSSAGGADTDSEYFSTIDSNVADEIDCIDCHDPALLAPNLPTTYVGHTAKASRGNNPYMLRGGITAAGAYDDLCRLCHGNGMTYPVGSHDDGAAGRPVAEHDGTRLKTTPATNPENDKGQCTKCHDTHYSGKVKLFNDGHEGDLAVDGGNCTAVCHFPGDDVGAGSYNTHGHNKGWSTYEYRLGEVNFTSGSLVQLTIPCTGCHAGMDTDNPTTRTAHVRGPNVGASNQEKYLNRFNLDKQPFESSDTGSIYGNPLRGICTTTCHQAYEEHATGAAGAPDVGCLDCHDEHAENSGPTSNAFMIPVVSKKNGVYNTSVTGYRAKTGGEAVAYDTTRTRFNPATGNKNTLIDFYNSTNTGVCDNSECHGARWGTNLDDLMTTGGAVNHSGGPIDKNASPSIDCEGCHRHSGDVNGGWGAGSSCDDCHADATGVTNTTGLPRTHGNNTESLTVHTQHTGNSAYVAGCQVCHAHNGVTDSPLSSADGTLHMDGWVNFNGSRMPGTGIDYSAMSYGGSCVSNNTCHDSEGGEWKAGLNANGDGCADCHAATGKLLGQGGFPPVSNKHTAHDSPYVAGEGGAGPQGGTAHCTDCHGANADAGNHNEHLNGSVTIATSGTNVELTGYNAAVPKTCTNNCHVAGLGVAGKSWTTGALVCLDCHTAGSYVGSGANMPTSGLHTGVPTVTGRTHDDSFLYNNGVNTADCTTCHTTTPTNPSTGHIDGTLDASVGADDTVLPEVNLAANVGFTDAVTPSCAPSLTGCHTDQVTGTAWGRSWGTTAANTDGTECANCHGGSPTDAAPSTWTAWTPNAGILVRPAGIPGGPGALTAPHASDWDGVSGEQIQATHNGCKTCHGMNSPTDAEPAYSLTTFWGAGGGFHGNGSIDINGPSAAINAGNNATPVGAEYNGNDDGSLETSDYSCTKACHQGAQNVNRNMGDSAWPLKYGNYGAGNCNGCHGYPPLTAADFAAKGANYPDALVDTAYGGYAGGGDAHNAPDHVAPTVTANNGWAPCLPCHDSTSHMTTTSVVRANITVDIVMQAAYNAKSGTASFTAGGAPTAANCANVSCHGGQTTPFWEAGTLNVSTCSNCHVVDPQTAQANASQWNAAWSGLHGRAGSVSLENHTAADASVGDITDSNACNQCHLVPFTNHFAGLDTQATDALTDADFVTTYDGTGGNISNTTGCRVTCHSDTNAGTPRWARKWSDTITTVTANGSLTGPECANCHGTQDDGWVSGVTHRGGAGDAGAFTTHGQTLTYPQRGCNECHAIGSGVYTFSPKWNNGTTGHHGNETIELNNAAPAVPARLSGGDAGETGCTGCHVANDGFTAGSHSFQTVTRWGFATLTNGQFSGCNGCHGSTTGNFWPDNASTNLATYPNRNGRHVKHIDLIIARLNADNGWGGGAPRTTAPFNLSQADQALVCGYCHGSNFGGTHYVAGWDGTLSQKNTAQPADVVAASFKRIWTPWATDVGAPVYTATTWDWASTGNLTGGGTCATTDCHNNVTTAAAYGWYGGSLSACAMCHTNGEPDVKHQAHVNSSATMGYNAACTDCHSAGTASGTPPTAGHINGTLNVGGAQTIRGYATTITYSAGSCGTNICHNRGYSVAGPALQPPKTAAYTWGGASIAGCDACHDDSYTNLITGSHARHLTTLTGGTDARNCTNCHTAANNANHMNRTVNMGGTVITLDATYTGDKSVLTPTSFGTCGTNACHNNGTDSTTGTPLNNAYAWNTAIDPINSCTECHNTGTLATQAHQAHLTASANGFGISISCANCHGTNAEQQTTHTNGSVTLSGLTYGGGGDLDLVTPNTYGSCGINTCHNDGNGLTAQQSNPLWNAAPLGCVNCHQDTTGMVSNSHNEHTAYTNALCTDCHTAANTATHINGSTNFDAAKAAYSKTAAFANDNTASGTCTTASCHNILPAAASVAWDIPAGTGTPGTNDLTCSSCHGNGAGAGMSGSHDPHLTFGKPCTACHGAAVTDTTHISTRPANLTSSAVAATGEATVAITGVTWASPNCTYAGANGILGCHATGNAQWGVPTSADACIECHTNNTTTQVNPSSGLHNGATPASVSGKVHDETIAGGCEACHTATPSTAHQNGTLVSNDANLTGTAITTWDDALKTCVTNTSCHTTNSAAWAHKWNYNETVGTAGANACAGCHGDWDNGWNAGVTHRTSAGTQSTHGDQGTNYDCYECHVLESAAYTFTFGTDDWRLTGGTSHHGDGTIQVNANAAGQATLYLQGTYNGTTGTNNRCSGCHTSDDGTHQMPDTGWSISTALSTASAITADCNTCHGDSDGANTGLSYPDGSRVHPDDNAGAHQTHVDAIAAGAGISAIGGATCNRCHSGNSHATGTVELGFTNVSGVADADGGWSGTAGVSITCTNIDCHGAQSPTPNWYGDQVPPVFSPNNTITVQDPITGGELEVSWNAATDADTPPVTYDLFRLDNNTTGDPCTDGARVTVATNLGATSYLDTLLSDGTPYRYCVQAKDGVTPTANRANSTSAHASPSPQPTSQQTDYYLTRNNGTLLWTGNSTNGGTCGSATITTVAQVTSTTWPPNGRYGLATSQACASSSTNNYFRMSATSTAGVYRNLSAFYKLSTQGQATTATLSATGTSVGLRSSANSEDVRIFLAAVSSTGTHTASTSYGQVTNITSAAMANWTPTVTGTASVSVPAGSRLAVLIRWADSSTTASGNDQVAVDNYNGTIAPRVRITEAFGADTTAPAFPSNNSSITAVNAGTGGAATVNWVAATDAYPSDPVRYTVYGVSSATQPSAAALFTAPNVRQSNLTALSTTVTGLVNGTNYYWFGVRATDAANNAETANTTISTPGVTPTGGGGGGVVCGDCHGVPPATGAHAAHADGDADYTDCEACHGTVAGGYTTTPSGTHNNGSASFAAGITYSNSGTAANKNDDTCNTTICHSPSTGFGASNAVWGTPTSVGCNDCHYYEAVPNAANAAAYVPPASATHGDHFAAGKTCTACHPDNSAQTTAPRAHLTGVGANDGAILTDQAVAVADEALVTRTNMTFSDGANDGAGANNTCTNSGGGLALGCHASGSPDWEVAFASTACLNCHTNETTPAVNPSTGLHVFATATRHDDTLLTGSCINCHSNTATRTAVSSLHQDGTLQNAATATFGWNGTNVLSYTRATDSCQAAVACHTDGGTWNRVWTAAVDADPLITDNAATAAVCGNCHGSFFTGWNIVGSTTHLNPDVDNDPDTLATSKDNHGECSKCHGWGHASYTATMHNNGTLLRLQMNSDLGYQDGGGTAGQCTTNCHGGLTLSMDTNSGWTVATGAFGGVACGDCHTGGVRPGAANNSGAHDAHGATDAALVAPGTVCQNCHGNNGGLGFQVTAAGSHGIGGVVNWTTNLTYSTAVRNDTAGTCSGTAACHVASGTGAVNIQWGQTQVGTNNCLLCHQGTADVNDYIYTGTAAGTPSAINNTEYGAVGHGSANGNATACNECHDSSVPHDTTAGLTGTNPFRLIDQDTGTGGLQFSCSFNDANCHLSATATNEAGLSMTYGDIQNHERANFASPGVDTWSYTPKCVDCHDPHGDGSNVKMVHNDLWDNGSSATMVPTSYPITDNGAVSVTFTTPGTGQQAGAGAYAMTASPFGGICQECHERNGGASADPDMTSYLDNYSRGANATGTANVSPHPTSPGDCSTCHSHKTAFQPSGCTGCHGAGGPGTTGPNARRAVADEFNLTSHHVQGTAIDDAHCTQCHAQATANPNPVHAHMDGTVVLWADATAANVPASSAIFLPKTFTAVNDRMALIATNAHCLSCHKDGVAAPFVGDANTPLAKAWNGKSVNARWASTLTVSFGKYSSTTYNVSVADTVQKAYSPHYAVQANKRGVATTGAWADTGGSQVAVNTVTPAAPNSTDVGSVACLYCHSSHGSDVVVNRSWASGGPTGNLGMLISAATSRLAAAAPAYTPAANATLNQSAEADLCFDCHVGGDASAKVTYENFNLAAAAPIAGYGEGGATTAGAQGRWGVGATWTGSFTSGTGWTSNAYKPTTLMGSHFVPATAKANSQGAITANTGAETYTLNGNCSSCHDPHGVDQTAANFQYMVPALKGTWLTSPYKEDRRGLKHDNATSGMFFTSAAGTGTRVGRAPRRVPEFTDPTWNPTGARGYGNYNKPPVSGGGYGTSGGSTGQDGYFIDLNTFGYSGAQPAWGNTPKGVSRNMANTADAHGTTHTTTATYAGLCMTCHTTTALGSGTTIGSVGQIHVTSPGANTNSWVDLVPTKVYSGSRTDTGQPGMHGGRSSTFSQCDPTSFMGHGTATARTTKTLLNGVGGNNAYAMYYRWDVIMATQATAGGTQSNYHRFACSKCHWPHASALPRLMRTNCLETSLNNNDERQAYYDDPETRGQFTRAVNCHSEDWVSTPWNTKTPWNGAGGTFTWTPPTLVPSSKANGTLWDWEP